jgi:polysaccharide deacetylase family protein (PEP-CTERM system associated)
MRPKADTATGRGGAGVVMNALTIDVEDYYMVSGFADVVRFEDWCHCESRVERSTYRILDLLAAHEVHATFFVLGWIGERCPSLVASIHAAGHEIACHGYNHRLIYDLTPGEFREDVRRSKAVLEDITGAAVVGYRATSYSIVERTMWALDILVESGFQYDSSIFPVHHDRYGVPGAERFPHRIARETGSIMEFPPSTCRLLGQNIPVAGGGYLRLFPLAVTQAAIRRINKLEQQAAIVYAHPWEIDVHQPRISGRRGAVLRHYLNIGSTFPKLEQLVREFSFQPLSLFAYPHAERAPQESAVAADRDMVAA